MKKVFTFILAIVITACCLSMAGCGEKDAGSDSGTSSGTESSQSVKANLGGKTVTVATWRDFKNANDNIGAERVKYFEKLEKDLDCKLDFQITDKETITQQLITTAMSGTKFCDIAIGVMWNTASVLTNRAFADLNKIDTVHLDRDYYDQNMNTILDINGIQRAASCGLTCTPVSETAAVVFNKRILKECGLENPYDLYKNNKWTLSKMREMAKTATKDLDGVAGMGINDQYGITTLDTVAFAKNILTASDAYLIAKEKGGSFVYNMGDDKIINNLKFAQDWIGRDNSIFINSSQDAQHAQFSNGKALFYTFQLSYLSKFTEMKDDYGIVPFPRGDEVDKYIGQMNWNTSLMGIPVTVGKDEINDIGSVFEALASYSASDNETMKNTLAGRFARDEESIEMMQVISETGRHTADLVLATPRMEAIEAATTAVFSGVNDATRDIAQLIASTRNSGKSAIALANAALAME